MYYASIAFIGAIAFLLLLALFHAIFKTPKEYHFRINTIGPVIAGGLIGVVVAITVNLQIASLIVAAGLIACLAAMKFRDWHF